ncbi:AAA family ATPase [Asaia sp. BMEF1]|uniref:AAA family ATPase n=1 Tax=unclassified Asaia TaxID=2685023 RepID=UPI0030186E17
MGRDSEVSLEALGPRVIVMGPSNSGKSTLSVFIGRLRSLPVVHLDLLRHEFGSFDRMRPEADFHHDHSMAIEAPSWVMDGNYSSCLEQRLARATGAILLDVTTLTSLRRYLGRCLTGGIRYGGWDTTRDPVRLSMVRHIIGPTRSNRRRYRQSFASWPLPKLFLPTPQAVAGFRLREEGRLSLEREGQTREA